MISLHLAGERSFWVRICRIGLLAGTCLSACAGVARATEADGASGIENFNDLSIEELANVQISSVSKKAEPLSAAPSAVYVITHDDIARSGAMSVPEMLRLAPNLQVARSSSVNYAITARGFNGTLANKLLVLIDGRSVYTPLYGGVYWDMQDVIAEDVDRIEVISGPGATLWGANAVNGVINIITRSSDATQGGFLDLNAGTLERGFSARYGGRINDDLTYRFYAKATDRDSLRLTTGADARDSWTIPQGGFRIDWKPDRDTVTVQGDIYRATEEQIAGGPQDVGGQNLMATWEHRFESGSALKIKAYYDRAQRFGQDKTGFSIDTYDIDLQHSFSLGSWNDVVWGAGYRLMDDHTLGVPSFFFSPAERSLSLSNVFVQDTIRISDALKLTVGTKLEDDPYTTGAEILPTARLSWSVSDGTQLWAAVSRAVRAPTRYDTDIVQKVGALTFLTGDTRFTSEKLIAYEVGTHLTPSSNVSISVSGFYHIYDDLKSVEVTPITTFPLYWRNRVEGETYGIEASAAASVTQWWRLSAAFNVQHQKLRFKPGASQVGGLQQAGNDSDHQISVRSSMNLTDRLTLDADFRYVGSLPNPVVPGYVELNGRIGWSVSDALELYVTGSNLLHDTHVEFMPDAVAKEVPRSVLAGMRWKF